MGSRISPALTVPVVAVVSATYWYLAFRKDPILLGHLASARVKLAAALAHGRK